ncbi:MAG: hypothetical protein DRQ62_09185 [Gammaproteobacteria bacterium]|nr:MAG: hypothetical protein DRQ62_09185 [Gammaproteobacteria bacterium]
MAIATAVLDFSGAGGSSGSGEEIEEGEESSSPAASSMPFRIDVVPEQPVINTPFYLEIYAADHEDWTVTHSGAGGGDVINSSLLPGLQKVETIELGGANTINVDYPVGSVARIVANSGVYNADSGETLATAGSRLSNDSYKVLNGEIIFNQEGSLYGALTITYETTGFKKQNIAAMIGGTHYLNCKGGAGRQEMKTIVIGNADAGSGEAGESVPLSFVIHSYVTDLPVVGATVEVAGKTAVTDATGTAVIEGIDSGQTLPIKITASGYHDSDEDTLNNDEINT